MSCTGLGLLCVVNVGDASSKGIEAELTGQVTENIDLSLGYTYIDSELKSISDTMLEFMEDGTAFADMVPGTTLAGASKHNLYIGSNIYQPLSNNWQMLYSVNGSYRSKAESTLFVDSFELDSFWLWNVGVSLLTDEWTVRAFVDNVFDERGLLGADPVDQWGPRANAVVSRPRTFGIMGTYRF